MTNQALLKQAIAKIEERELSEAKACREMDVSTSYFSQWKKDKFPGNLKVFENKVQKWLDQQVKSEQVNEQLPTKPAYFETPTSKRILSAITYAQMANDLVVIYGGAGNSKTETIQEYKCQNNNVWVVEATPTTNSVGSILRAVAHSMGADVPVGHSDMLERSIRTRLKDTKGLLIIDEAQFLNVRALEILRRITELSEVGLVLAGDNSLYIQMSGAKRAPEFAQLFSRIGQKVRLTKPTKQDIKLFCDAWKLTGEQERSIIHEICQRAGALRQATKTLRLASMMASATDATLSSNHLRKAYAQLSGE